MLVAKQRIIVNRFGYIHKPIFMVGSICKDWINGSGNGLVWFGYKEKSAVKPLSKGSGMVLIIFITKGHVRVYSTTWKPHHHGAAQRGAVCCALLGLFAIRFRGWTVAVNAMFLSRSQYRFNFRV